MADEVTYTEPIGERVYPGTLKLEPRRLLLDLEEGRIEVLFAGDNGVRITAEWRDDAGEGATDLIIALNALDLRTNTLRKRLITRAVQDGKIPSGGTVS